MMLNDFYWLCNIPLHTNLSQFVYVVIFAGHLGGFLFGAIISKAIMTNRE